MTILREKMCEKTKTDMHAVATAVDGGNGSHRSTSNGKTSERNKVTHKKRSKQQKRHNDDDDDDAADTDAEDEGGRRRRTEYGKSAMNCY